MFGTGIVVRLRKLLGIERAGEPTPPAAPAPADDRLEEVPVASFEGLDETGLLGRFRAYAGPGEPGFMIDFLGGRTRIAYLKGYEGFDGQLIGVPKRHAEVLHEQDEWLGTLAAVRDAEPRGELVVIELGAGWGPWIVSAALAARQLGGFRTVRLVGVEATTSHHEMMFTHFRDNGLDPAEHDLLLGAAGDSDGTARFPRLPDPAADWGATELSGGPGAMRDALGRPFEAFDEVPRFSVAGLVGRFPRVDLLHVDIQGAEETALPIAMPALTERVRRVVVGTHGRRIDRTISDAFAAAGWVLEARQPSRINEQGALYRDGTQVWRNDRLA